MRPPHRFRAGERTNLLIGHVQSGRAETVDDQWISPMATGPKRRHPFIQDGILPIEKVAENVQFAPSVEGADFDAGDDFDAQFLAGRDGLRDAAGDVVVGNGQRRDPGVVGQLQHFGGCQASIRVGGMKVKIDAAHGDSCPAMG